MEQLSYVLGHGAFMSTGLMKQNIVEKENTHTQAKRGGERLVSRDLGDGCRYRLVSCSARC